MRNLLLLFLLAIGGTAFGQITITQSDMPEPGDTLRYSNAAPQLLSFNQTGANQFWDYSSLVPVRQGREDYVYSLQTIYAFFFLGANQYGTKIGDTLGGGPFTFTDVYNFFRSASSDFRAEGVGFRYQGLPLAAYYSDEDELYRFPLNYGDRDTSTYRFSVNLGSGTSFMQKGTRYNYVDGWGRIKTPWDSLPCLRLVSETDGIDSITFNGFSFGMPRIQRSIKFLANGVHIPMLEVTGQVQSGIFQPQQIKYRDGYQNLVANSPDLAKSLKVYPNPSQGLFRLELENGQGYGLTVLDPMGQLVMQRNSLQPTETVDLQAMPAGTYFLMLQDAQGMPLAIERLVIQK